MNWIQSALYQMLHRMRLRSWLPMVADATTALPSVGSLTYVMAKVDGDWRIALAQTTPIA